MKLLDKNISYIIISAFLEEESESENINKHSYLEDSLYLLDYTLSDLNGEWKGLTQRSYIAYNIERDNNSIRKDLIYLLGKYNQESGFIKYKGDVIIKKVCFDGSENNMSVIDWDGDSINKSYFLNGRGFSLQEQKRYFFVKDKKEIKEGMILEYQNNNKWIQKVVKSVDTEWDMMYKLLVKYNKLRYI